jgi:glucokinase
VKTYLCLDIGGSKYIVGLVCGTGEIVESHKGGWPELTQACVLDILIREARTLLERTGIKPDACGITIPGLADSAQGLWVEAQFSGIRNFPICDQISNALNIPTYCDNDAQAYALAEQIFGCCKHDHDFIYVNVSNGIGGSIVSGGRLLYGAHNNAGEFGHCVVVPNGRRCKCGSRGCLEMYAAGPALAYNYAKAGGAPDRNGQPADAKCIAERARAGESMARETFECQGRMLGSVIAKAVNLLNPQKVVIGGGISLAFDLFGSSLRETVASETYTNANPDLEILPTPLGYLAGLYGAAAVAITQTE